MPISLRGVWCFFLLLLPPGLHAQTPVAVPETPPPGVKAKAFHDRNFGVRFEVPRGWTLARHDREVSTFHLDARTAPPGAVMRSVAAIQFNPYPYSTFSGALFYYSVEPKSSDIECARQATAGRHEDMQDIGGAEFVHGHDEHGNICVEARDEVYTTYRKGACYRFDLAMNTFCSVSSGAADMTDTQLEQIDRQMTDILSTVRLDWTKAAPHAVPVPALPPPPLPPGVHAASLQVPEGVAAKASVM